MNRKKASKMEALVRGFADYQGSKKAYCDSHNIRTHVFDYYRKKLNGVSKISNSFVPIQIQGAILLEPLELYYPNGNRIRLSLQTPLPIVAQLVQITIENKPADV